VLYALFILQLDNGHPPSYFYMLYSTFSIDFYMPSPHASLIPPTAYFAKALTHSIEITNTLPLQLHVSARQYPRPEEVFIRTGITFRH